MRVLHVIPSLSLVHGGPTRAIRSMQRGSRAYDIETLIATSDDDGPGRRMDHPMESVVHEPDGDCIYFAKVFDAYKTTRGMAVWLWRNVGHFDVCHVHALFSFSSTIGAMIAIRRRVPLVVRPLGTLSAYGVKMRRPLLKRISMALIERPILRRAAAIHCTSVDEALDVSRVEPRARTVVVPLAVQPPMTLSLESAISHFPQLSARKVVLYLSRLDRKKNIEALLDGWSLLNAAHTDAMLVIAGSGEPVYEAELRQRSQSLGIAHSVMWTGNVEGSTKAALLTLARVFVLPSFSENFGIAAAEALSYGLPCIVSRGVALASEIASADAGKIVEPSPSNLASAMTKYLNDDVLCRAQGEHARRLAALEYSEEALGQRLQNMYRSVLQTSA